MNVHYSVGVTAASTNVEDIVDLSGEEENAYSISFSIISAPPDPTTMSGTYDGQAYYKILSDEPELLLKSDEFLAAVQTFFGAENPRRLKGSGYEITIEPVCSDESDLLEESDSGLKFVLAESDFEMEIIEEFLYEVNKI